MPHQGPHALAALATSLSGTVAPLPDDAPAEHAKVRVPEQLMLACQSGFC